MKLKIIFFLIFYIWIAYVDFKHKAINSYILILYMVVGILLSSYDIAKITDLLNIFYSMLVGFFIYIISVLSNEQIGKGDGIYLMLNSLYINYKCNLLILFCGLFVSFIISMILFLLKDKCKYKSLPFIPCFIPAIIGVVLCTQ